MRLTRPPYILAHPGDNSGCGYHRILRPIQLMTAAGVAAGQHQFQFLPDEMLKALNPQIVIFQRQADDGHIATMQRYRAALPNATFIYEVDDALSAVPEKSWHFEHMPKNVDKRLAAAIPNCDILTVTTHELADHMRKVVGKDIEVRVVPNMLGRDDLMKADAIRQHTRGKQDRKKLRVGWAGGIGHIGDLQMIRNVFAALKDEVQWVFLGMNPELPEGVTSEFHGAVTPDNYMAALSSLDVDLVIAPLEDNLFNRCKSNLRLIESGACSYPVIASPVAPYLFNAPPVTYANNDEEWISQIREFAALTDTKRFIQGEKLRRWVERNYVLEDHAEERIAGWLPKSTRPFVPKFVQDKTSGLIIVSPNPVAPEIAALGSVVTSFEQAAALRASNSDLVYIRTGVKPTVDQIQRLAATLGDDKSTISVASNEAGPGGFPKLMEFVPIDVDAGSLIDKICSEQTDIVDLPAACGPLVVIRRSALNVCGWPDFDIAHLDIALIEWSASCSMRGFKNVLNYGVFLRLDQPFVYQAVEINNTSMRINMRWPHRKVDEAKLAKIRSRIEIRFHRESFKILPPQNPTDYSIWVDTLDTPGPRSIEAAEKWLAEQVNAPKIIVRRISGVGMPFNIEEAADWVIFIPLASATSPLIMAAFTDAIHQNPQASVIYADHDYLDLEGKRQGHWFKPNFDLHGFLGNDYVTQCVAIKRSELHNYANVDADWSQEKHLFWLILNLYNRLGREAFARLPRVMAHIQVPRLEDLDRASTDKISAITSFATGVRWNVAAERHPAGMGMVAMSYRCSGDDLVSIIVPTKNNVEMLTPCIATLLRHTKYANYEVIIVDNGSTRQEMLDYLDSITDPRVRVVRWPEPYNWSKLNNYAARVEAKGTFLCLLNDDTRVLSPDWLTEMVGAAKFPGVGAVGARLSYPHGTLQHVGVLSHKGLTGHLHKGAQISYIGYHGYAIISHEATAVTGACLLVSRDHFEAVGGLNEDFAHNFNDVAFCVELRQQLGLVNVVAMRAELQHLEGATRVTPMTPEGRALLLADTKSYSAKYPEPEYYWDPNLLNSSFGEGMYIVGLNFDILNWQVDAYPWWSRDKAHIKSILLIGNPNAAAPERHDGLSIYHLAPHGITAKVVSPPLDNCVPFDLRKPEEAKEVIKDLGITEVIITGLDDASPLMLGFLTRLGVPITYRPLGAEAACPRGNLRLTSGQRCADGWRNGTCQGCIDAEGSPHGPVNMVSWMADWVKFLTNEGVTVDGSFIGDREYITAITEVYGADQQSDRAEEDVRAA